MDKKAQIVAMKNDIIGLNSDPFAEPTYQVYSGKDEFINKEVFELDIWDAADGNYKGEELINSISNITKETLSELIDLMSERFENHGF